jgi:hypothetical protein
LHCHLVIDRVITQNNSSFPAFLTTHNLFTVLATPCHRGPHWIHQSTSRCVHSGCVDSTKRQSCVQRTPFSHFTNLQHSLYHNPNSAGSHFFLTPATALPPKMWHFSQLLFPHGSHVIPRLHTWHCRCLNRHTAGLPTLNGSAVLYTPLCSQPPRRSTS